jgi:hypothetical protein
MIGYLPFMVWFALLVYCILDIDRTAPDAARVLPIHWWFVLVVAVPIAGAVAWLVWGRPTGQVAAVPAIAAPAAVAWPSAPAHAASPAGPPEGAAPEFDRSLRAELERIDREFDEMVRLSHERHPGGRSQPGDPPGTSSDG